MSPEPGATSWSASSMTRALSPRLNFAVCDVPPADDTDWPIPTASDELNASTSSMPGWCSRSRFLESSLHITPDEVIMNRLERSHRSGSASSAARIGLAKASPTRAICWTFSRSTVSSSSMTSRCRAVKVTTLPPMLRMMSWV